MAMASILLAAESSGNGQAQGGSPGAQVCQSEGCHRHMLTTGHRFCCSNCKQNPGGIHTRRCEKEHRRFFAHLREVDSTCITTGCTLRVGAGHLTCCSSCGITRGMQHTVGCNRRRQRIVQQAATSAPGFIGTSQHTMQGQSLGTSNAPAAGPSYSLPFLGQEGSSLTLPRTERQARGRNTASRQGGTGEIDPSGNMVIDLTELD